jgi:hypothetical protein
MSAIMYGCDGPGDFRRLQGVQDPGTYRHCGLTEGKLRRIVEEVLERLRDGDEDRDELQEWLENRHRTQQRLGLDLDLDNHPQNDVAGGD